MHLTPYRHYYPEVTPPRPEPTNTSAIDALLDKAIRKPTSAMTVGEGRDQQEEQRTKAEGLLLRLLGEGNNQNMKKYCRNLRVRFPKPEEPPTFADGRAIRVIMEACGEPSSGACVTPNTALRTPARPPSGRGGASETHREKIKLLKSTLRDWSAGAASASRRREAAERLAAVLAGSRVLNRLKGGALKHWRSYVRGQAYLERVQLRFARKGDLGPSAVLLWQYPACIIAAFGKWRRWTHWARIDAMRAASVLQAVARRRSLRGGMRRLRLLSRVIARAEGRRLGLLKSTLRGFKSNRERAMAYSEVGRRRPLGRTFSSWITLTDLARRARIASAASADMLFLKRSVGGQRILLAIYPLLLTRLTAAVSQWRTSSKSLSVLVKIERLRMRHEESIGKLGGRLDELSVLVEHEKNRNGQMEAYLKHVIEETRKKLQQAQGEYEQLFEEHQNSVAKLKAEKLEMEEARRRWRSSAVYVLGRGASSIRPPVVAVRDVFGAWMEMKSIGCRASVRLARLGERLWQEGRAGDISMLKRALRVAAMDRKLCVERIAEGADLLWLCTFRSRQIAAFDALRTCRPSPTSIAKRHADRVEAAVLRVLGRWHLRSALARWRTVAARMARNEIATRVLVRAISRLVVRQLISLVRECRARLAAGRRDAELRLRLVTRLAGVLQRIHLRDGLSLWRASTRHHAYSRASLDAFRRQRAIRSVVSLTGNNQSRRVYWSILFEACRLSREERQTRISRSIETRQKSLLRLVLAAWSSLHRQARATQLLAAVVSRLAGDRLQVALAMMVRRRWSFLVGRLSLLVLAGRLQFVLRRSLLGYLSRWRSVVHQERHYHLVRRVMSNSRRTRLKRTALCRLRAFARFCRLLSTLAAVLSRVVVRSGLSRLRKQVMKCRTARFLSSTVQQVARKNRMQQTALDFVARLSDEAGRERVKVSFLAWRGYIEHIKMKLASGINRIAWNHHRAVRQAWMEWIGFVGTQLRSQSVWAATRQKREFALSMGLVVLAKILERLRAKLYGIGFAAIAAYSSRLRGREDAKHLWQGELQAAQEEVRYAEDRTREYAQKLQRAHEEIREVQLSSQGHLRSIKDWEQRLKQQEVSHSEELATMRQSLAAVQHTLKNERDANVQLRLEAGQSEARIEALARDVERESRDRMVLAGEVTRLRSSEVDMLSAKREIEAIEAGKREADERARHYEEEIKQLRDTLSDWKLKAETQKEDGHHIRKLHERHSFYKQKCTLQEHQISGLRSRLDNVEAELRESHRALIEWQQHSVDMLNLGPPHQPGGGMQTTASLPNFTASSPGGLSTTTALASLAEAIERVSLGDARPSPKPRPMPKRFARSMRGRGM
ncbi:hypothetical protein FOL47_008501 [Perkinsus chesapeaki]|uniref:Uncharacterized protein n=1 Tax=Perkinsus chesapeaki TaxID=330153 RepID=A0A7J6MTJ3_PERCH|nr:hypothetical protein FOL47_008501 [Perkinsus chesapeaki]